MGQTPNDINPTLPTLPARAEFNLTHAWYLYRIDPTQRALLSILTAGINLTSSALLLCFLVSVCNRQRPFPYTCFERQPELLSLRLRSRLRRPTGTPQPNCHSAQTARLGRGLSHTRLRRLLFNITRCSVYTDNVELIIAHYQESRDSELSKLSDLFRIPRRHQTIPTTPTAPTVASASFHDFRRKLPLNFLKVSDHLKRAFPSLFFRHRSWLPHHTIPYTSLLTQNSTRSQEKKRPRPGKNRHHPT